MHAEIVMIGTELLLGELVDTNANRLAKALCEIGLDIYYKTTVGDNEARIAEVLNLALDRSDVILTSGGIGPTVDDMTRQAVADATGRKLTIEGSIDIGLGLRPTLIAEDVGLENAPWGAQPELARVKRLEVQLAFLPLIWGELDFARLVLIEPEVIVELDSAGTSNFSFGPPSEEKTESAIPPPPLIFGAVLIEKGLFIV